MMALQQTSAMSLKDLLTGFDVFSSIPDLLVSGMAMDSRLIVQGDLFIACAGHHQHGLEYAEQAITNGASMIVAEVTSAWLPSDIKQKAQTLPVPVIMMSDLTEKVSQLAGRFYNYPSRSLCIVGITGTNGKTSCSHFIASALRDDCKVGVMGTLGNGYPGEMKPSTHTTMDPVSVQAQLAVFANEADIVAMEVSSHALKQSRVAAVCFDTVVLTNFSRDHLDYHGTMADYAEAKSLLFKMPDVHHAVINADDELGRKLIESLSGTALDIIEYGIDFEPSQSKRFLKASSITATDHGLEFDLQTDRGDLTVQLPVLGEFNVMNAMVAMAVMLNKGLSLQEAAGRLAKIEAVNGRMQLIETAAGIKTLVDFAHTPDALQQLLTSARQHVSGKLICVFGCGGDRDKGKRPLMAKVAERYADKVFITDDNPRTENSQDIIQDILNGFEDAGQVTVQADRQKAICEAIAQATTKDLVVVAGKGHENYQIIGDTKINFSDQLAVMNCHGGVQ